MEADHVHEAPSLKPEAADPSPVRFAFVDGLRGLAALSIVIFHAWWYEPEPRPLQESLHWLVELAILRTRGGVQVLLVISGFVIAYSLRNTWVTPREVLSFVGRRFVRLVPAYWVALGFVILVEFLCRVPLNLPPPFTGQPTVPRVLTHLFFLQDVFDYESLSAGLWTVCIEMQFYVVAVLGWGLAQRFVSRDSDPTRSRVRQNAGVPVQRGEGLDSVATQSGQIPTPTPSTFALLMVFAPLAIASLVYWYRREKTDHWVTYFLWRFFLGMITWWTLDRTIPVVVFKTIVAIGAGQLVYELAYDPRFELQFELPSTNAIALATALAIFVAGRRQRLHVWLNWRWLQFVSRISYSLYLIHFSVTHMLVSAAWKWCGNSPTTIEATGILAASVVVSLVAGSVLYVLVEAPSVRWAAKLKSRG